MTDTVRVWVPPDLAIQHVAAPPGDDTTREWQGTTACGQSGLLRWVHGEVVDQGATCEACLLVSGPTPPLEGDDPGPV